MADRWIVSAWNFHEHGTLDAAEKEVERLSKLAPKKTFTIHRKKTTLKASNAAALIAGLRRSLLFFADCLDVTPCDITTMSKDMRERATLEDFDTAPAEGAYRGRIR